MLADISEEFQIGRTGWSYRWTFSLSYRKATPFFLALSAAVCTLCRIADRRRVSERDAAAPAAPVSAVHRACAEEPDWAAASGAVVDVSALLTCLLAAAAPLAARRRCHIQFAVQPALAACVDARTFREAMADIIAQAVAKAPNGHILVGARRDAGDVLITITFDRPGPGRIAELAAATRALQELGGGIRGEAAGSGGATAALRLPLARASSAAPAGMPGPVAATVLQPAATQD